MTKFNRQQAVTELTETYVGDTLLARVVALQLMDEYERDQNRMGLQVDWDFMGITPKLLARNPQAYYERIATVFFDSKSNDWLKKMKATLVANGCE